MRIGWGGRGHGRCHQVVISWPGSSEPSFKVNKAKVEDTLARPWTKVPHQGVKQLIFVGREEGQSLRTGREKGKNGEWGKVVGSQNGGIFRNT